jgi:hypothetical protein
MDLGQFVQLQFIQWTVRPMTIRPMDNSSNGTIHPKTNWSNELCPKNFKIKDVSD